MTLLERPLQTGDGTTTPTDEVGYQIKPDLLSKFALRSGITDLGVAEVAFRDLFAEATPVKIKKLPEQMPRPKGGVVSYYKDPTNPDLVYQVVTRGRNVTVERAVNFGSRTTRGVSY